MTQIITASGKTRSLTPHCDDVLVDPNAKRLSVEYARARASINEDYKLNFKGNQAMAERVRRQSKDTVIQYLGGKVAKKLVEKDGKKYTQLMVTFPDGSQANL